MPQMAPILWFGMFILFISFTYFLASYLFFLCEIYSPASSMKSDFGPKLNWKW
uniref:ATP synthase complex subunit 8 n=1 Tax=Pseudoniphargus morenoi TaxID=2211520 RepID=A0A345UDV3_9CRUS|nr:ATP synthase F0 subunit 8 [Pseudoniphargus morenoi]